MPDPNPAKADTPGPKYTVEAIKDVVQGGIGIGIGLLLVAKLSANIFWGFRGDVEGGWPMWCWLRDTPTLAIVGEALMFSAGVELAYMLFTPGPDEAVQPLILGLAAAGLLVASDAMDLRAALIVAILTLAIGFLFFVRQKFVESKLVESKKEPPPFSASWDHLVRRFGLKRK